MQSRRMQAVNAFIRKFLRSWEAWLTLFYKTSEIFCLLPITWDKPSKSLQFAKNRVKAVIWAVLTFYLMGDTAYQMLQIFTAPYASMSMDATLKLLLHGLTRLGACAIIIGFSMNLQDTIRLINQVVRIHRKLKANAYGDENALIDDGLLYVTFGVLTVHVQPFGPLMQHLQERQGIRYWGHFLPPSFYNSAFGIALFGLLELYISYMAIFGTGYCGIQLIVYAQTTRHWLIALEKNSKKTLARQWINLKNLRLYRTLAVLNCVHNEACSDILWPVTQHVLATVHVIANVLSIKCFHILPLPIRTILILSTFAFAYFEKSCLKAAADVYEISKRYRDNMAREESKRSRIIGRSLMAIRIKVSSAYYFKISTFITFACSVVEHTITVMLTFF